MGWKKKMERARRLHRPTLKDWECDGLHKTFPAFVQDLEKQGDDHDGISYSSYSVVTKGPASTKLPVVLNSQCTSASEFGELYEAKEIPSIIRHIPLGDDKGHKGTTNKNSSSEHEWPAMTKWQLDALEDDDDLRNRYFKCGEDDDGKSIKIKLKHFMKYLHTNKDDSPLYIFDSAFDEDKYAKRILEDYRVPSYFRNDLFRFISESRRPPYRWFLVGPERSGTTVHIDPLATSAWNTLIYGQKRWVLFPPHVPKHIAKGTSLVRSDEDDEAIHYFMTILPRMQRKARAVGNTGDYTNFICYEFTQHAGDTVFIPNGWWHAVINLTHTVGVTQNFCSPHNFNKVWIKTRTGRKRMAYKWLLQLEEHFPHLAQRAKSMNKRDKFIMKYDPREIREREKKEERLRQERKQKKRSRKEHSQHQRKHHHRTTSSSSSSSSHNHHSTTTAKEATATTTKHAGIIESYQKDDHPCHSSFSQNSSGTIHSSDRDTKRTRHVSP